MSAGDPLSTLWPCAEKGIFLPDDEVHVWLCILDRPPNRLRSLLTLLTTDERERAARYHFEKDRHHFIVARGMLRTILGNYLRMEPEKLRFGYGSHGKPFLFEEQNQAGLRFNLSHSGGLALLAVSRSCELGVDIEFIRPDIAEEKIADRFFSAKEVAMLHTVPDHLQAIAFFNCWTRKEAYIKARGEGLSLPLDLFDVSLLPGEPAELLGTRIDDEEISRWSLIDIAPAPGYAGALVAECGHMRLKRWRWPD